MNNPDSQECATGKRPVLVVFELHMMGDAVISLPFIRAARTKYDVFVLCRPATADVFAQVLPLDHLILWTPPWAVESGKYRPSRWRRCDWAGVLRQVRESRPDVAVCAWADARMHVLMALSGAPVRAGFPMNRHNYLAWERPWRRRLLRAGRFLQVLGSAILVKPLLTHRLHRREHEQAHLEDWHQLADSLHLPWSTSLPWLDIGPPPSSEQYLPLRKLRESAQSKGEKVWLVHSGASMPSKRWPADRFQTLVDRFFATRNIPLIIVKPGDSPSPVAHCDRQVTVETPSFRDLAAVINLADCVVCNDSLVSHLSAALGKKVVALFGSGDHNWFAPFGNAENIVHTASCPHTPCVDRCVMSSLVCVESISVETVEKAITRLL